MEVALISSSPLTQQLSSHMQAVCEPLPAAWATASETGIESGGVGSYTPPRGKKGRPIKRQRSYKETGRKESSSPPSALRGSSRCYGTSKYMPSPLIEGGRGRGVGGLSKAG
ncbi:hypothetical protein CgunFtcFv8_006752 [Champsocephalus gunnari]|uniref:Uncharacterized protein n=1 Tax=Champsocephalus gunnari TaxID=52237 RepID=A0AAN8C0W9_CHAGU|nr:hypothetical protein CgunFtcFv8_006752 [Champsocephalus gunnari]